MEKDVQILRQSISNTPLLQYSYLLEAISKIVVYVQGQGVDLV